VEPPPQRAQAIPRHVKVVKDPHGGDVVEWAVRGEILVKEGTPDNMHTPPGVKSGTSAAPSDWP
jgi:hypothetical protein